MKKMVFNDPNGDVFEINDYDEFRDTIMMDFETYWLQGSGDGFIDYYEDDKKIVTLFIGPNIEYGIYLRYFEWCNEKSYLSLFDSNKLNEVAETAEEIYASIGLFLPIEIAWKVIQDFLNTGKTSNKIKWITPHEIPEGGNW